MSLAGFGRLRAEAAYFGWLAAERGRFALFLPVFMGAGVIAYFALRNEPPLWPAPCAAVLALAGGLAVRRSVVARAVCFCCAFAAAGFFSADLAAWRASPWDDVPRTAAIVRGVVAQVDALPEGRRVTLRDVSLNGGPRLARAVRVRLRDSDPVILLTGDTAAVRALLRRPSPPEYPGGWDTQRDAFFSGLGAYGFAIGQAQRLAMGRGGAWQGFREAVAGRIMAGLPGERGAIAATLMTGLGTAIPPADRAAFAASGLAHLLAVAGLHIGIVMGLVFLSVRTALAAVEYAALHWPCGRIAAVAALAAGGFYLALSGAHVPILRSFGMASLVTLALVTGRRAVTARALALAALALMIFAPSEVMGVSFQMSFSAVLALVAGWEALRPWLHGVGLGKWWRPPFLYGAGLAVTSSLAGTASLPFAAYHFGSATLWYVPANMLAVPITAFWVMPLGLAALLLMPFGWSGVALAPMGWGVAAIIWLARNVAAWPGAVAHVPLIPPGALLVMAAGLAWLCLWRTRLRLLGLAPLLAGCALMLTPRLPDAAVAPDASVVAARIGGSVFVETHVGASPFARQSPARIWGGAVETPFPASGDADAGLVRCDVSACRWRAEGQAFLLARDAEVSCSGADVAIAAIVLHGCDATIVVDRRTVREDGATMVLGQAIVTDAGQRGDRPWVIRDTPRLPPARTE